MERYHKIINHNQTIIGAARETHECFAEVGMISAYAWNAIPIEGTDIIRSIPAIDRSLWSPLTSLHSKVRE